MSITLDKRTALHIHVGANIPGYLPESDVGCFDDLDTAIEYLRHALKDQQDYYYEQCKGHCPDCAEFEACGGSAHGESCAWCDAAADVEAALSAITDGDAMYWAETKNSAYWRFSPPEGPDVAHWLSTVDDNRETCLLNEDD